MLILRAASDLIRVVTGSAADVEAHVSAMEADNATPPVVQDIVRVNTANITTATTTTIVDCTTANRRRNIKHINLFNNHASVSTTCRVEHTDGTNVEVLANVTLLPGESLVYTESGLWVHYDRNGGVYPGPSSPIVTNYSTAAQGPGFASDTYVTGSYIKFSGPPKVGTTYRVILSVSKTAAGTATPILNVRLGTAGTTADTSRHTFTFNAGTAAADVGTFEVTLLFRSVGSGTSAITQAWTRCVHSLSTTGFINTPGQVIQATSSGFDSTTADFGIGVSLNGGTSASWTVQQVNASIEGN